MQPLLPPALVTFSCCWDENHNKCREIESVCWYCSSTEVGRERHSPLKICDDRGISGPIQLQLAPLPILKESPVTHQTHSQLSNSSGIMAQHNTHRVSSLNQRPVVLVFPRWPESLSPLSEGNINDWLDRWEDRWEIQVHLRGWRGEFKQKIFLWLHVHPLSTL